MKKFTLFLLTLFLSTLSWQNMNAISAVKEENVEMGLYKENRNSSSSTNSLVVKLYTKQRYINDGPVHDSFGIDFAPGNSNAITPLDAIKPMNFYENLGINLNGTLLSYESRAMPQVGEVFYMYSSGYQKTEYVLKITVGGLQNTVFYLEDSFTGKSTSFGIGDAAYHFTVNANNPASIATNRFSIRVDDIVNGYMYKDATWSPANPSGVSLSTENVLIVNGTATLSANTTINNIVIQKDATLEIANVLNLKGDITAIGNLVFLSTPTSNGEIGKVLPTSSITGKVTVQQYMKGKRSYRMVSSPVTTTTSIHTNWQESASSNTDNPKPGFGTHITGTSIDQKNGFDKTDTAKPSMFTVNVAAQQFQAIGNTDVNVLEAGSPYLLFVRGDRSIDLSDNNSTGETILRASGSLFNGTHFQNFPNSSSGQFVMFGNPYQSAVNLIDVFGNPESSNLNTSHYYVYDPTLGDHGAYVIVNLLNGVNNTSGSFANQYLQPGQAAQVAVTGPATVVFKEDNKAVGNFTSSSRNQMRESDLLTVQLYTTENFINGGPVHDSFGILFSEENDNRLTLSDAIKPMNFYENLGINQNGTYLSLERREMPQPQEVISLYSSGYTHSEYTLKLTINGLEKSAFYLEDNYTGKSTPLISGDNIYNFGVNNNATGSIASNRFSIRTENQLEVNDNNSFANSILFPSPLNTDTFYINAPRLNGNFLTANITELSGRVIYNKTLECRDNTITVLIGQNIASGLYMVNLEHKGKTQTYRLVKE